MASQLAAYLERVRRREGWDVKRMSEELGISRTALRNILEDGGTPKPATLQKIADALHVPVADLQPLVGFRAERAPDDAEAAFTAWLLSEFPTEADAGRAGLGLVAEEFADLYEDLRDEVKKRIARARRRGRPGGEGSPQ